MTSRCYILNLPVEVLDLVFKAIPDMKDKLNLAKAHHVLGMAFAFHARDRFKAINMDCRLDPKWSFILSLCGSSVTKIQIPDMCTLVASVALAAKYCPYLEEFSFPVSSHTWEDIKPMLLILQNLNAISLDNEFEGVNVVDTLLQMPKLKNLELIKFNRKDWESVGKLVNLTRLTLKIKHDEQIDIFKVFSPMKSLVTLKLLFAGISKTNNSGDEPLRNFGNFHTSLPYLQTLKILVIDNFDPRTKLNDIFGESVFRYAKTLECLYFCTYARRMIEVDELGIICKLKALRRLYCQVRNDVIMEDISQLEHLERLAFRFSCMTNRGVLKVIQRCRKLRDLEIFACPMVDEDILIKEVLHFLSGVKPDNPLVLRIGPSLPFEASKLNGVLIVQHSLFQNSSFKYT